jgi:glycosyltransferase involved in cell wall biosynthesis
MWIAVFLSHPIQHFTPLWQALSRQRGVTLKVFYYSDQAVKASYDPDFGVTMAWDVDLLKGHDYEFLPRQWPTRSSLDYSWKGLNKNLRGSLEQGWDVAYVADYAHVNNWAVAWHCRRMGIPLLCQIDSNFLAEKRKSRLRLVVKRPFVRTFFRGIAGGLAVGDHCRDYFLYYGMSPQRVFFCPIPVDVDRFQAAARSASADQMAQLRQKYRLPEDKDLVIFSGKFTEGKRPCDLVRAMKLLVHSRAVAVFIGDGKLRPLLEREGEGRIIITGFVNQKEIPLLLSLGSLAVLTSEFDAHPLAVTEACALGLPVILSDTCGCWGPHDILRDGENGLLYPCGNVPALAEKIGYLLGHPEVRARFSKRAVELASTQSPAEAARGLLAAAEAVKNQGAFRV